jgi:hypothetical protein
MRLHRRCKAACWERDRLFAIKTGRADMLRNGTAALKQTPAKSAVGRAASNAGGSWFYSG